MATEGPKKGRELMETQTQTSTLMGVGNFEPNNEARMGRLQVGSHSLEDCVQLKLDYDGGGGDWLGLYNDRLRFLKWLFGFEVVEERFYRSDGGGHHVRLWIDHILAPCEVSLLQAIMGSDPVREGFNLRRIRAGQQNWNLLFNTGKEYKEIAPNSNGRS